MRKDNSTVTLLTSLAIGIIAFFVFLFAADFPWWLAGAVALAIYGSEQFLFPFITSSIAAQRNRLPSSGNAGVSEQAQRVYYDAVEKLSAMGENLPLVSDSTVKSRGQELYTLGESIVKHLRENPKDISPSQYFLTYWLPQCHDILSNYQRLESAGISPSKLGEARSNTVDSLEQLKKVFVKQRDGFYEDAVQDTKYTKQLLDQTVEMQETMMIEEGSTHE